MAYSATITIPANVWTKMNNADVAAITFLVESGTIKVQGVATGGSSPTTTAGAFKYQAGYGRDNLTLADHFLSVTSPVNVYAWSDLGAVVAVQHA